MRFDEYFEDQFHFLMILSNLAYREDQTRRYSGTYQAVSNNVRGTGRGPYSFNADFGVGETLQAITHFPYRNAMQNGPSLHELMHQWANWVLPSAYPGHWGFSSANGQLGGFNIDDLEDLGNGRYAAGFFGHQANGGNCVPYSPIELYLAGFISQHEVPELWVADDGAWLLDEEGKRVTTANRYPIFTAGNVRTYTIDDIIAEHGPRLPDHTQSQKSFRAAAVLLIDENHPATRENVETISAHVSWFSRQSAAADTVYNCDLYNFHEATGGRGAITMDGLSQFQKTQTP